MKKLIFQFSLSLIAFKSYSQFHIGDKVEKVMIDVVQYKNCSEPMKLENSVYWTDYAADADCYAFLNSDKIVYKFVVNPKTRESFNLFLKSFKENFLDNGVGEWFAAIEGKAFLIKAIYDPKLLLKYVITYTKQ